MSSVRLDDLQEMRHILYICDDNRENQVLLYQIERIC